MQRDDLEFGLTLIGTYPLKTMSPPVQQAILEFWFGAAFDPASTTERPEWFRKDQAFDRVIGERFGDEVESALAGKLTHWANTALGALALVLLLDQFPRNLFRGSARAFAGDAQALATAKRAIDSGFDHSLAPLQRWFLYMPFEHSESWPEQERSLALFDTLARETGLDVPVEWAQKHAEIIRRFDRYPHRNLALSRPSTAEEIAFLEQPGSSF